MHARSKAHCLKTPTDADLVSIRVHPAVKTPIFWSPVIDASIAGDF
jgi:hypothetical protein